MDWAEAQREIRDFGRAVRRASWPQEEFLELTCIPGGDHLVKCRDLGSQSATGWVATGWVSAEPWEPSADDLAATDWERDEDV